MKNNNEMEDNMEKYIEKKAIECLMRTLRNKKEFSIEEIIKMFSDDIKNTEASINKIISNRKENIDKKLNTKDEKEKNEIENTIKEINKKIKQKVDRKEILLKSLEIIEQAIAFLQMTLKKCQDEKGKERISVQEIEKTLLNNSNNTQGDFYKNLALIIFELENKNKLNKEDERKEATINYNNNEIDIFKKIDEEEEKRYQEFLEKNKNINNDLKNNWNTLMNIRNKIKNESFQELNNKYEKALEILKEIRNKCENTIKETKVKSKKDEYITKEINTIPVNRKNAKIMKFPNTEKKAEIIIFPNVEDDGREQ